MPKAEHKELMTDIKGPSGEPRERRDPERLAAEVRGILRRRQEAAALGMSSLSEFEEDTIPALRDTAPDVLIALCETMTHDQSSGELRSTAAVYAHLPYTLDRDTGFQLWRKLILDPDGSVAQAARLTVEVAKEEGVITAEDAEALTNAYDERRTRPVTQLSSPDQTDEDVAAFLAAFHGDSSSGEKRGRLGTERQAQPNESGEESA